MAWGFRRSKKLLPGVRVNLGKRGASVRLGPRGAGLTVGPRGTHASAGVPGTGLHVRKKLSSSTDQDGTNAPDEQESPEPSAASVNAVVAILVIGVFAGLWWLI